MGWDQYPLSAFEVDCDGSACASGDTGRHIHPPQIEWTGMAVGRVTVRGGKREGYSAATGIERLVMVED